MHFSQFWMPEVQGQVQQVQCLLRANFLVYSWNFLTMSSLYPYLGEGKMEPSWVCFAGALIPFMGTQLSCPKNFLKSPPSHTITFGHLVFTCEWGGFSFRIWEATLVSAVGYPEAPGKVQRTAVLKTLYSRNVGTVTAHIFLIQEQQGLLKQLYLEEFL